MGELSLLWSAESMEGRGLRLENMGMIVVPYRLRAVLKKSTDIVRASTVIMPHVRIFIKYARAASN
jgi:hypothetical protein